MKPALQVTAATQIDPAVRRADLAPIVDCLQADERVREFPIMQVRSAGRDAAYVETGVIVGFLAGGGQRISMRRDEAGTWTVLDATDWRS